MGGKPPKPLPDPSTPIGRFVAGGQEKHPPSLLEECRRAVVIGSIIGIRRGLAVFNPMGNSAVDQDNMTATTLQAQGDYDRAFEVATGFPEYFDIYRSGKKFGARNGEIAAVMVGQATGFNQVMEAKTGENRDGKKLAVGERIVAGLEGAIKVASTTMTVAGGVELGGDFAVRGFGPPRVVSPVYQIAGRDVVVVETSVGRQAFYRSSGANSQQPGRWFPVDEFLPGWFNKGEYTLRPGLEEGTPLHRLGSREFARISERLGEMSIPEGQQVPAGQFESEETTLNRILDFFRARETSSTMARPIPEQ